MASQIKLLELWDGLDAIAGKVRVATEVPWGSFVMDQREDGDDSLTGTIPLWHPAAALAVPGYVWRVICEDATVHEFIISVADENVVQDTLSTTAVAARTWLNSSTITGPDETYTGTPTAHLGSPIGFMTGWPSSWVIIGTIQPVASVTVQYSSGDSALARILKLVAAVDATLSPSAPPCVLRFRRVSDSQYAIDILTTPATGTVNFRKDRNIYQLHRRKDGGSGTTLTGYQMEAADLYRAYPTLFPYDNIKVYENARLQATWGSVTLDTSVRIARIVTPFGNTARTTVELGEPRRRLVNETESVAALASPPAPALIVTPGVFTATTMPYVFTATVSAGTITGIRLLLIGTTATGSATGPIADGVSTVIVAGETITIDKPAVGDPDATALITVGASGGGSITQPLTIPPQVPVPPELEILVTPSATDYSIGYTTNGTLEWSTDGAAFTATGITASPLVVARPASGDPVRIDLRSELNGLYTYRSVDIAPQGSGGGAAPTVDFVSAGSVDFTNNTVSIAFGYSNAPVGATLNMEWSRGGSDGGASGTVTGISTTSPYVFDTDTLDTQSDLVSSAGESIAYVFRIKMYSSGAVLLAQNSDTFNVLAVITP